MKRVNQHCKRDKCHTKAHMKLMGGSQDNDLHGMQGITKFLQTWAICWTCVKSWSYVGQLTSKTTERNATQARNNLSTRRHSFFVLAGTTPYAASRHCTSETRGANRLVDGIGGVGSFPFFRNKHSLFFLDYKPVKAPATLVLYDNYWAWRKFERVM